MAHPKRECPYTPDRLHEMYWRSGMTPEQIADHCRDSLSESRPARQTVLRWLTEAEITLRTKAEAVKLYAKQHPEQMKRRAERIINQHTYLVQNGLIAQGDASQMHTRKARAAQRRAMAKLAAPLVTRRCIVCDAEIIKKQHRFQGKYGSTCSRKCAIALLAQLKKEVAPPVECLCPVCGKSFTVQPNRLKRVSEPCCSRSCSNRKTKSKDKTP